MPSASVAHKTGIYAHAGTWAITSTAVWIGVTAYGELFGGAPIPAPYQLPCSAEQFRHDGRYQLQPARVYSCVTVHEP
jgi:hypothetical protein